MFAIILLVIVIFVCVGDWSVARVVDGVAKFVTDLVEDIRDLRKKD